MTTNSYPGEDGIKPGGEYLEVVPETLEDDEPSPAQVTSRGVVLPFGADLDAGQLRNLQLARPVRTISLFGEHRSGKTTLISELYRCFCNDVFAGHMFAESRTIEGFERRLHPSRLDSGRSSEDTARTSSNKDLSYLHLRLRDDRGRLVDLAWADRAGEDYRAITRATDPAEIPFEIGASNHVAFLIDGAKLAESSERPNVVERVRLSLRKLIDLGVIGDRHAVSFVTTKADLLQSEEVGPQAMAALESLRSRCARFESSVGSFSSFLTSVRQDPGSKVDLPRPYGLDELLRHWTTAAQPKVAPTFEPCLIRQYDRLLNRHHGIGVTDAK